MDARCTLFNQGNLPYFRLRCPFKCYAAKGDIRRRAAREPQHRICAVQVAKIKGQFLESCDISRTVVPLDCQCIACAASRAAGDNTAHGGAAHVDFVVAGRAAGTACHAAVNRHGTKVHGVGIGRTGCLSACDVSCHVALDGDNVLCDRAARGFCTCDVSCDSPCRGDFILRRRAGCIRTKDAGVNISAFDFNGILVRRPCRLRTANSAAHTAAGNGYMVVCGIRSAKAACYICCNAAAVDEYFIPRRFARCGICISAVKVGYGARVEGCGVVFGVELFRSRCPRPRRPAAIGIRCAAAGDGETVVHGRIARNGASRPCVGAACRTRYDRILELVACILDFTHANAAVGICIEDALELACGDCNSFPVIAAAWRKGNAVHVLHQSDGTVQP